MAIRPRRPRCGRNAMADTVPKNDGGPQSQATAGPRGFPDRATLSRRCRDNLTGTSRLRRDVRCLRCDHDVAMARVLLVEDDDGIRAAVRFMLEDEGYDVVDAATGE